jgi:hypothetical protein
MPIVNSTQAYSSEGESSWFTARATLYHKISESRDGWSRGHVSTSKCSKSKPRTVETLKTDHCRPATTASPESRSPKTRSVRARQRLTVHGESLDSRDPIHQTHRVRPWPSIDESPGGGGRQSSESRPAAGHGARGVARFGADTGQPS